MNLEASQGGQDIEDWSSVYKRGSRYLRHRGRAVTREDYEDLALQASQQIARAKCCPLLDLTADSRYIKKPGVVSLIIVPQSLQAEPKPNLELLQSLWNFLDHVRDKSANLIIVGPEYVRISVEVVVVPKLGADITSECRKLLENFLHPLTGGEHSGGWNFGQLPHPSDMISLLEKVSGIEFVKSLQISKAEERKGLLDDGFFLICSGNHKINLSL
jgi:predicted phage baseplate assembly protein